MYHAGAICRIGCRESRARFDGQFGLLWKRVGEVYANRVRTTGELLAKARARVRGDAAYAEAALLGVLKFFVPGHLDGFQLSFVR